MVAGGAGVDEALFWAARHGSTAEVAAALAKGASVRWHHPVDGRTPLAEAVAFDHLDVLESLLAADAEVDAADTATGLSPLGLAIVHGSARCLCHLLRAGASLEWRDQDGWTPLMHAAAQNQLYEAQQLLAYGADLEATVDGIRPRELAAVGGHNAILSFLDMEAQERKRKRDRPSPDADKPAPACVVPASPAAAVATGPPAEAAGPLKQSEPRLTLAAADATLTAPIIGAAGGGEGTTSEGAAVAAFPTPCAQIGSLVPGASGSAPPVNVRPVVDDAAGSPDAAVGSSSALVPPAAAAPPATPPPAAAASDPRAPPAAPLPAAPPSAPPARPPPPPAPSPGARDVKRARCAAPLPGHAAPTRLEVQQEGDDIVVRLHSAEIVRLRPSADLVLSSGGGWRTVSALDAINGSLAELLPDDQITVTPDSGEWIVTDSRSGDTVPFAEGLVIPTARAHPLRHAWTEGAVVVGVQAPPPPPVVADGQTAVPQDGLGLSLGDGLGGLAGAAGGGAGVGGAGIGMPAGGGGGGCLPGHAHGARPGMAPGCGGPGHVGSPGWGASGGNPVAAVVQYLQSYPPLFHAVSTNLAMQAALMRGLQAGGMAAAEQVALAIERGIAAGGLHGAHAALVALLSRQEVAGPTYAGTEAASQPTTLPAATPGAGARDGIATDPRRRS